MSFLSVLEEWPGERVRDLIERSSAADVERALAKNRLDPHDLAALLSPAASGCLEEIARVAQRATRWHFGRTIGLYVPVYISNVCAADCAYCGYATGSGNREKRRTLTEDEIRRECEALASIGFQNVLLLTGEAPAVVPVERIARAVSIAYEFFPSVSVEVYALDEAGYRTLVKHGLEGVTLYAETYDRATYGRVHFAGRKRDYPFRINAIERAGLAGVRRISIGALLGLHDWRVDGFWTALHGLYLQRHCWQSAVAISFPRLRHVPERFAIPCLLRDRELVQLMLATRLFLPEVGFNLSTREPADLRDRLIHLGVTMMSAGSSTRPGGYATHGAETLEQFEVEDTRSPADVVAAIRRAGYDPIWKDFDYAFEALKAQ